MAMRRCVLGKKTFYAYFPVRPTGVFVVVAQHDKRFASKTQKGVLSVGVVR